MVEQIIGFALLLCMSQFFRQIHVLQYGGQVEPSWLPKHAIFQYAYVLVTWIGAATFCFGGFYGLGCVLGLALAGNIGEFELRSDQTALAAVFAFVMGPAFTVLLDTTIREKESQAKLIKHYTDKEMRDQF